MINNTVLVGRVTKDIELKQTQANKSVTQFVLAVNRQFKNANGEREADFINIVAWGKTAELLAQYAHKGSQIGVVGRIQTRNYENQQGQRVYVTEVVAESMTLLDSKGNNQNQQAQPQTQQSQNQTPDFGRNADPFSGGSSMTLSDDDLPF
ncbi:single-stranded DNA-binding protein [Pseudolactococcus raffinolactis]|uniref:single-stranded DNA-binding protein n=1 Tax=Pseudolactococcus raffinolactis TaxID=1366 RepID=UPI00143679E9|nr:single-stranded DNA-binding protein [Lactococcus raffinolactis]QIW50760.1 single-stranded DNA-binding protein [Lactococcus raffinolactis]